jgi:hypothetical protein
MNESFLPLEIELCWAGRFLEYLMQCTMGNDALPAYHMISYRIICRMADILQGKGKEKIVS